MTLKSLIAWQHYSVNQITGQWLFSSESMHTLKKEKCGTLEVASESRVRQWRPTWIAHWTKTTLSFLSPAFPSRNKFAFQSSNHTDNLKPKKIGIFVDFENGQVQYGTRRPLSHFTFQHQHKNPWVHVQKYIDVKFSPPAPQVSFYNVEAKIHVYTFNDIFGECVYPFFSPCANKGGKNEAPLTITAVESSEWATDNPHWAAVSVCRLSSYIHHARQCYYTPDQTKALSIEGKTTKPKQWFVSFVDFHVCLEMDQRHLSSQSIFQSFMNGWMDEWMKECLIDPYFNIMLL